MKAFPQSQSDEEGCFHVDFCTKIVASELVPNGTLPLEGTLPLGSKSLSSS